MEEKIKEEECPKHGQYISEKYFANMWSKCPECVKEFETEKEAEQRDYDKKLKEDNYNKGLLRSGVSRRFKECTLENYIVTSRGQEDAFLKCREYYNNFSKIRKSGSSLFFCGKYGTGKTHLAIAILLQLMRDGTASGKYITTMKMIRDIRSSYSDRSLSEQGMIDKYINTPLLIIDEVGVQLGTDAEKLLIYEVINGRYEEFMPTILISNLSFNEMTAYLGARAIDRLKSRDGSMIVMDWESYRNKKEVL